MVPRQDFVLPSNAASGAWNLKAIKTERRNAHPNIKIHKKQHRNLGTISKSTEKINKLRISLIQEELDELKEAMTKNDLLEVADALTDLLYVTYGAGHAFGIDLDKCFNEVQNSNMSKLGEDGKPIYNEFGKVMKGPKYFKPNLDKFINER